MIDQCCVECGAKTAGTCGACEMPVCKKPAHAKRAGGGVLVCEDPAACIARFEENRLADVLRSS